MLGPASPRHLARLPALAARHARARRHARWFERGLRPTTSIDAITLGDLRYGGYVLPMAGLGPDSVCYLAGVGTDITFDLLLIARFGCHAYTFDPVPVAAEYVRTAAAHEPRLTFHPWALWGRDEELTFHAPREEGFVSHSAVNLHDTAPAFRAPGRSVSSLMREFGHSRLDLLKISAEGSEHAILAGALRDGLRPTVVCVEFAQPAPLAPIHATMGRLEAAGYQLLGASIEPWNWKLTWVVSAPEPQTPAVAA